MLDWHSGQICYHLGIKLLLSLLLVVYIDLANIQIETYFILYLAVSEMNKSDIFTK